MFPCTVARRYVEMRRGLKIVVSRCVVRHATVETVCKALEVERSLEPWVVYPLRDGLCLVAVVLRALSQGIPPGEVDGTLAAKCVEVVA